MRRSPVIATAIILGLLGATPSVSQATDLTPRASLETTKTTARAQNRWLDQFGTNAHVDPLCPVASGQMIQVLSMATCSALATFQDEPVRMAARSVRISQIKRNRALWNALSRRDRRILEQYEVVVVGQAGAVEAKTGSPR